MHLEGVCLREKERMFIKHKLSWNQPCTQHGEVVNFQFPCLSKWCFRRAGPMLWKYTRSFTFPPSLHVCILLTSCRCADCTKCVFKRSIYGLMHCVNRSLTGFTKLFLQKVPHQIIPFQPACTYMLCVRCMYMYMWQSRSIYGGLCAHRNCRK